jgi:hypothetical protein
MGKGRHKMKRNKYRRATSIIEWFLRYISDDDSWRNLSNVPINNYERFVIKALTALSED